MRRLPVSSFLAFPLRMTTADVATTDRSRHVRDQIEQVLFTMAGERVFRADFGAGAQRLVFEPNAPPLWELTRKRLLAALIEALKGEVDPRTLDVRVGAKDHGETVGEELDITVTYALAALGGREEHSFRIGGSRG